MATLTAAARDALPDSDFALPGRKYPIHDPAHARDALARAAQNASPEELATIRRKVKARYPGIKVKKAIRKAQAARLVDIRVPVWKDDAKQLVYGVVLVPDQVDSQGDVVSKEEIEKAAHSFLVRARKHDVQHSDQPAAVETVESYIAPQDMDVAGQRVVEGSWVMGVHVSDPEVWGQVKKGDNPLDGFSIAGLGERSPIAA